MDDLKIIDHAISLGDKLRGNYDKIDNKSVESAKKLIIKAINETIQTEVRISVRRIRDEDLQTTVFTPLEVKTLREWCKDNDLSLYYHTFTGNYNHLFIRPRRQGLFSRIFSRGNKHG